MPVYVSDDVDALVEVNVEAIPIVFRTETQLVEAGAAKTNGVWRVPGSAACSNRAATLTASPVA
jgi:hypothetical protein